MKLHVPQLLVGTLALLAAAVAPAHAETVKIAISKLIGYPAVPVAIEHGYFKEQGIEPEMVFFDSAQPVAIAVASGDTPFGISGMSASFYTLAAGGQLRLIASSAGDAPEFYNLAFVVSNKAYDGGLTSIKDLAGHSVAITQAGTSLHYAVEQAAEKLGFPLSSVTVKALQSNTNVVAALIGGTIDAGVLPGAPILGPLQKKEIRLLNWAADVAPNLVGSAAFASAKELNEHGDTVKRFLVAYQKGMRDFHNAFASPDGKRADQPTAPDILAIMSKFTGVAPQEILKAIPYIDPEGRLDVDSVAAQIAWYKSQNLLKGDPNVHDLIDSRYALKTESKK